MRKLLDNIEVAQKAANRAFIWAIVSLILSTLSIVLAYVGAVTR